MQKRQVSTNNTNQSAPVQAPVRTSVSSEFNPDYSYVKSDLKRIGILAGTFFAILVALSFFLR